MSTRYLRKVYGTDQILTANREDSADLLEPRMSESKLFNVFDLLNENSESEEKENSTAEREFDSCNAKRKKKKKKRKKNEHSKQNESSKEREAEIEPTDEIERTIREVNKLLGEPQPSSSRTEDERPIQRSKELILSVQPKQLNPYNELKRMCGSKIIQAEQSKRRNRGRTGYTKKTWLVIPRENWSPIGKPGLSMSIDTSIEAESAGITYFVFVHNSSYRDIQNKFFEAVDSQNPENIISIMDAHTYHVDTLLQLSDLCKLNEDLQMSAKLVERAVYCMECALHPSFNITTGKCRLSYKKQTNRAFFIALFKHMMFVGGRACYRTSLEFCKFLLTLDPENDPLAIVLAIDFYALRAREYEWFIDFCELWEESRNLTQLPNIAFSLALAHFHVSDRQIADELLQNALFMFPGVLLHLLDKCGVQTDLKVQRHDYFTSMAESTTSPALEKLQDLYVARSYHLWKEPDVISWLEKATHSVFRRVDSGDEYAKFCRTKRAKRYQGQPPRNILRHIILSDFKEVTISHHAIRNTGTILSYDPLPPADSIDSYQRGRTVLRPAQANSNIFSLFMSSLYTDLEGNIPNIALNGVHEDDFSEDEID